MPDPRLSLVIITRNEEEDLPLCLESVRGLAEEIVLVDNGSADKTVQIAESFGARVCNHPFESFSRQKQKALDQASGEWVLHLDADERLSPELKEEISFLVKNPPPAVAGYELPYQVHFMGKILRFGGLGSERHLRLFRRKSGRFVGGKLHEGVEVAGPLGRLKNPVVHRPYKDLGEYLEKVRNYTSLGAQKYKEAGKEFRLWHHAVLPLDFVRKYFLRLGFLDGQAGFVWCALSAFHHWLKYLKLKEIQEKGGQ